MAEGGGSDGGGWIGWRRVALDEQRMHVPEGGGRMETDGVGAHARTRVHSSTACNAFAPLGPRLRRASVVIRSTGVEYEGFSAPTAPVTSASDIG